MTEQGQSQWEQVLRRKPGADWVYAVSTTGIFCRPDCPSRRPARRHVRFFGSAGEAHAAGYRPCLRCQPEGPGSGVALATRVSTYLRQNYDRQVPLAELGRLHDLSPYTVQRVFTKVVGMSPRAYANAFRAESYREQLRVAEKRAAPVTEAVYEAGFSTPSRAACAAPLGMAATRYRLRGQGEHIGYALGAAQGGLGLVLVAATPRGVCAVLLGDDAETLVAELSRRFAAAALAEEPALQTTLQFVLGTLKEHPQAHSLPLDLRGTAFQARVWAALRAIPRGQTRSYAQVAAALGSPMAVRAVAAACGANPAALLVPCHRVVGSNGKLTGYRWGLARKRLLLALEAESTAATPQPIL